VKQVTTYVGVDAHKKDLFIAMLIGQQKTPVTWQLANQPQAVRRLVRKLEREAPGPVSVFYEAGPCGYALQRQVTTPRVSCDVIAPALIPRKPGERVKTNRRDARKLVELGRAGLRTAVQPPTPEDEAVRDLARARDDAGRICNGARTTGLVGEGLVMWFGDGPRRRRMIRGTIARIGELAMRYGLPSQLATLDCTSSRRSTVMCALLRATAVTAVYQRDSSSKRPRSSVASAARAPTRPGRTLWRTRPPGLRALRAAPAGAPGPRVRHSVGGLLCEQANACSHASSHHRKLGDLTEGHSISA